MTYLQPLAILLQEEESLFATYLQPLPPTILLQEEESFCNLFASAEDSSAEGGLPGDSSREDVNKSFMPNTAEMLSFQLLLSQLLMVIGPPAKAIKCLESSFLNATDIYEFWLAVFEEVSKKNTVKLPVAVLEKIHHLCNYCFSQTINKAPSDILVTTFFLVPGASQKFTYLATHNTAADDRNADILKYINPLSITPIKIHCDKVSGLAASASVDANNLKNRTL
ncbi:hypothetical protein BDR06DRAFT_1005614 [Suillus hirtellus]|nr:hypothetical protein BDR06DRAFT_1013335 [Suillus hirtellus]KAG2056699.1 hypothetical protein BDR06DRAFT_1005614 [Suillus hirtellus]